MVDGLVHAPGRLIIFWQRICFRNCWFTVSQSCFSLTFWDDKTLYQFPLIYNIFTYPFKKIDGTPHSTCEQFSSVMTSSYDVGLSPRWQLSTGVCWNLPSECIPQGQLEQIEEHFLYIFKWFISIDSFQASECVIAILWNQKIIMKS